MSSSSEIPVDTYGKTFLNAIQSGNLQYVHEAINSGYLTTYYINEGLVLAVDNGIERGYVDIVTALLAAGALISPSVRNALPGEDMKQDPAVIRVLFDLKQTVGEPLLKYLTYTEKFCHPACMAEILIEYGTKLKPNYLFTSMRLRKRGPATDIHEVMTKLLLDKGTDPNQGVSEIWGTPLHLTAFCASENIVKMLLDAGADPAKVSPGAKYTGRTPEQLLQDASDGGPSDR
ncbi:hypothetical protein VTL71DRAFT_15366 [Oculimacula yallundae]|uniref:Ankyrin n=1 Tax=Oculimacula yallundae TaxID=86028 RepID=A0ABR4CGH4_9HELO